MSTSLKRLERHRFAKKLMNNFYDFDSFALIVHYSCESFYNIVDGHSPRVTSIAVRYLKSAQTKSFSIHKIAELKKISIEDISDNYDELEKEMLSCFFEFLKYHRDYRWIHWNMRDINYGFEALNHRAELLGLEPCDIDDNNKYDLSRLLVDLYGDNYSDHPRSQSILEMNNINPKNWLSGALEAKAFENKEFVKLHQSTLAKVDTFETIFRYAAQGDLKTKSTFKDKYGISPQGVFELIKDHWLFNLIFFLLSIIIGLLIGKLLNNGCG